MKLFCKILVRVLWLLVLLPVATVLLGLACAMLIETMEDSLNPALRYLSCRRIVQVEADAPVNPGLEGRVVEVVSAPVQGCSELKDPDFGVSSRAAFLRRYFRRVDGSKDRLELPEPLRKYHHSGIRYSGSCRVGVFRVRGQDAGSLLSGEPLDLPGTQDRQKLRIPQDLQSWYVEGTYPPRFRLSDGGVAELCYLCLPEGRETAFLGTQIGDTLVHDDDAAALLYCRQQFYDPSEFWLHLGRVAIVSAGTLPFIWGAVFLVQFALSRSTGGRRCDVLSLLLWLGLVCSIAADALHYRGPLPWCLEVVHILGYVLGALCMLSLLALLLVRFGQKYRGAGNRENQ